MTAKLSYVETNRIVEPADAVPSSWLDSLLSGPDAVLPGLGPWGCPDIERLLNAVKQRVKDCTPRPEAAPSGTVSVQVEMDSEESAKALQRVVDLAESYRVALLATI